MPKRNTQLLVGRDQIDIRSQNHGHSPFSLCLFLTLGLFLGFVTTVFSNDFFSDKAGPSGNLSIASDGNAGLKSGAGLFSQALLLDCTAVVWNTALLSAPDIICNRCVRDGWYGVILQLGVDRLSAWTRTEADICHLANYWYWHLILLIIDPINGLKSQILLLHCKVSLPSGFSFTLHCLIICSAFSTFWLVVCRMLLCVYFLICFDHVVLLLPH